MVEIMKIDRKVEIFTIVSTDKGYLHKVWEDWSEDTNYDFTDDPLTAMRFYGLNDLAPKYLYDEENNKRIETLMDVVEFMKGKLIELELSTTVEVKTRMVTV